MTKRKGQGRTSKDHPERSIAFLSQEIKTNSKTEMWTLYEPNEVCDLELYSKT